MNPFIRRITGAVATLALAAGACLATAATPADASPSGHDARPAATSLHQRIQSFWTTDKITAATSRDFVLQDGRFVETSRRLPVRSTPAASTSAASSVLGADWNGGGRVQKTTGRAFFVMNGRFGYCSASVTKDSTSGQSIITTAAHCVYNNAAQQYATNWMFVPDYDANPVPADRQGDFCAQTRYGCWTAQALVASSAFTSQTRFNQQATLNDFAFVVVGPGGHTGRALDKVVGAQNISFASGSQGAQTFLFGYPASRPYDGRRLIYSRDALSLDARNNSLTYMVASDLNSGCSGGPWFQRFSSTTGVGTQISVNSYGYGDDGMDTMNGPKFNAVTRQLYEIADTPGVNGEHSVV